MRYFYRKEIIQYGSGLPMKMYLCRIEHVPPHWHHEIEILFLVKGSLKVLLEGEPFECREDDLILFNRNAVHSFERTGAENTALIIQFDLEMLESFYHDITNIRFQCNSMRTNTKRNEFSVLRGYLTDILRASGKKEDAYILEINAIINHIIVHLIRNFDHTVSSDREEEQEITGFERLKDILDCIEVNYSQRISLEEISSREHISKYYFSHFFKKRMGISFQAYVKQVRLKNAFNMLLDNQKKIVEIAMATGFSGIQSFNVLFKKEYGITPTQLKKKTSEGSYKIDNHTLYGDHCYVSEDTESILAYIDNKG